MAFIKISRADTDVNYKFHYPFYAGFTGGYGSTVWRGLVPPADKQNDAISMSTPTNVVEGGGLWGLFAGYEFIPNFALEGSYARYPDATVNFDPLSLFTYDHNGITELTSHTETYSLVAKIMFIIPHSRGVRAFSSLGAADIHRYDQIINRWRVSPTFGGGFNFNLTDRLMWEIGANYTAGYGQSELSPAEDYVPFLYSVFMRLAYRF